MHPAGLFVLVLAIYYPHPTGREYITVTQVPGFRSYELCEAAGIEAQARLNHKQSDAAEQLDFVCLYQGKK